jgi:hypothetical protein
MQGIDLHQHVGARNHTTGLHCELKHGLLSATDRAAHSLPHATLTGDIWAVAYFTTTILLQCLWLQTVTWSPSPMHGGMVSRDH